MTRGTKINCNNCPDYKSNKCDSNEKNCLCRECPRNLGQCICVKYCRETESVLIFDEEPQEDPRDIYGD